MFFLQTFNSVCRIGEILLELQQHGHDNYMGWEVKVCCRVSDVVGKLGGLAKQMEQDLNEWRMAVSEQRQSFYHLNYFTTQQLLALRKELGCYKDSLSNNRVINSEIIALLQSISRNVTEHDVPKIFNSLRSKRTSAIIESSEDFVPHPDRDDFESMNVEPSSGLPEPHLSVADLSDVQKSILINLKQNSSFHPKLILLAFDKCTEVVNEESIESWCTENKQNFPYETIDGDRSDTVSVKSIDFSMEAVLGKSTTRVINEHHPIVKQFIEAGIDRRSAINAVQQYPDDPVAAMNCISEEENGFFDISDETADNLFGESHQMSHQMSMEDDSLHDSVDDENDQPPSLEYTSIQTQDSMECL